MKCRKNFQSTNYVVIHQLSIGDTLRATEDQQSGEGEGFISVLRGTLLTVVTTSCPSHLVHVQTIDVNPPRDGFMLTSKLATSPSGSYLLAPSCLDLGSQAGSVYQTLQGKLRFGFDQLFTAGPFYRFMSV